MPTSHPLMALMSTDLRSAEPSVSAVKASGAEVDGDFAQLLAAQMPEELQPVIEQLTPEQLAFLEQAALAVDGKNLPQVQDWLEHLPLQGENVEPVAEEALGAIAQWLEWLQAAPGIAAGQVAAKTAPSSLASSPLASVPLTNAQINSAIDPEGQLSADADRRDERKGSSSGRESGVKEGLFAGDSTRVVKTAAGSVQDLSAVLQRAAGSEGSERPAPAAMFGTLVEQLERAGRTASRDDADALEALTRPTVPGNAGAALTARPVAAATAGMGVPFGQSGWSEATVEKVMWMSSQNLRSVEIQLDPAELGPMEIHIQNRGQELQVQFVSQNPAVREALEAQMHRLREMFGQQGLEQTQVSVAEHSSGEQPGQQQADQQLAQHTPQGQSTQTGSVASETDPLASASPTQHWSSPRLIDYYA